MSLIPFVSRVVTDQVSLVTVFSLSRPFQGWNIQALLSQILIVTHLSSFYLNELKGSWISTHDDRNDKDAQAAHAATHLWWTRLLKSAIGRGGLWTIGRKTRSWEGVCIRYSIRRWVVQVKFVEKYWYELDVVEKKLSGQLSSTNLDFYRTRRLTRSRCLVSLPVSILDALSFRNWRVS